MSECEELNTLKEKLDELKETVAEVTDTIGSLLAIATEIEEHINCLEDENEEAGKTIEELEEKIDNNDAKDVVRELVDAAENWDYGLKGWRTLEPKQDLINYLKKEVLEA